MSKKRTLRWLSRALSFFRNVTGRQKDEPDIAAEVSAHLELLIEEKVRSCGILGPKCFAVRGIFFNIDQDMQTVLRELGLRLHLLVDLIVAVEPLERVETAPYA